jgi:glycosyltransferase involved in cell wall biosynthesis
VIVNDYPLVSVVMSVYNGAADVSRAIESILNQSFSNFEFIVIDNGSFKDDTRGVLRSYDEKGDSRLRIVELDQNIGLSGALNYGISLARGEFIARQDHDDISKPSRLEKQVAFMNLHPSCGLLGTRAEIWSGDEPTNRAHDHPTSNIELQVALLGNNPFVHSSVMFRRSIFEEVGRYTTNPFRQPPEDFELWSRIARVSSVANLPERLLIYREIANSMSRDNDNPFLEKLIMICSENIAYAAGLSQPNRISTDTAALLHGAHERISKLTEVDQIVNLIKLAITNIYARHGCQRPNDLMALYENNIRHHIGLARKIPRRILPLLSVVRTVPLPDFVLKIARKWLAR